MCGGGRLRTRLVVGPNGEVMLPREIADALGLREGEAIDVETARGAFAVVYRRQRERSPHLVGSFSALGVAEILQWVFTGLRSGVAHLLFGADEDGQSARTRTIYFREGQVVFARSSEVGDRLGSVLFRQGLVDRYDLERCTPLVESGRLLGQVLVDEGLLTPGQVYEATRLQVREIVLAACVEVCGEFAFVEGLFEEQNAVKLVERTRDLVLEGIRRTSALERIAATSIPDRSALLHRGPEEGEGLEPTEQRLLEEVDGERTVDEVIASSGLGLYTGLQTLAALLARRLVGSSPSAAPPSPAGSEETVVQSHVAPSGPFETYRQIFQHVFVALRPVRADAVERLNNYFERMPEAQRFLFDGVRLDAAGQLETARVLANVEAAGHRGAAARAKALEALEGYLTYALFEVKNCLSKPAAERFLREVGRMQLGLS